MRDDCWQPSGFGSRLLGSACRSSCRIHVGEEPILAISGAGMRGLETRSPSAENLLAKRSFAVGPFVDATLLEHGNHQFDKVGDGLRELPSSRGAFF